jgi:hypothetical protein
MSTAKLIGLKGIAVLAALGIWIAAVGSAETAPSPIQVTPVPPTNQQLGKPVTLGARVFDTAANRAVNNIDVLFLVETDVFGPRLMNVGKATTDATGTAYVTYKPSWEGDTAVVVRFLGNTQYAAGEGKFSFSAVGPANVHQNAAFGLESIRAIAPLVVIVLVLTVWSTLAFTVVHTVRGIRFVGARENQRGSSARRRRIRTAEE